MVLLTSTYYLSIIYGHFRVKKRVITQNGEAKVVIQDVKSYEETQEALALLKLLALGNRQLEEDPKGAFANQLFRKY